jgi:hypothetical protein
MPGAPAAAAVDWTPKVVVVHLDYIMYPHFKLNEVIRWKFL